MFFSLFFCLLSYLQLLILHSLVIMQAVKTRVGDMHDFIRSKREQDADFVLSLDNCIDVWDEYKASFDATALEENMAQEDYQASIEVEKKNFFHHLYEAIPDEKNLGDQFEAFISSLSSDDYTAHRIKSLEDADNIRKTVLTDLKRTKMQLESDDVLGPEGITQLEQIKTQIGVIERLDEIHCHMSPSAARANLKWFQLIAFLVMMVAVLTRTIKDAFLLKVASASSLGMIKIVLVLGASILVTILIMKAQKYFYQPDEGQQQRPANDGYNKLFNIIMSCFSGFFLLFTFFLLPNVGSLHLSASWASSMLAMFPGLKILIPLVQHWSYSLFYLVAELWTSVVFGVMIMKFLGANNTGKDKRSNIKNILLFSNLGTLTAGLIGKFVPKAYLIPTVLYITCAAAIGIMLIANVLFNKKTNGTSLKTPKLPRDSRSSGFISSMKKLYQSPYAWGLFVMVLVNGMVINFIELTWKATVKKMCFVDGVFSASMYASYTSMMWITVGISTILFTSMSDYIYKKFGWQKSMLILPIMMGITCATVFITGKYLIGMPSFAVVAVAISTLFVSFCKALKYGVFDPGEEAAYGVSVNSQDGKTDKPFGAHRESIKMIGARLSKALGGATQTIPLMIYPFLTQFDLIPAIAIASVVGIYLWANKVIAIDNGSANNPNATVNPVSGAALAMSQKLNALAVSPENEASLSVVINHSSANGADVAPIPV